MGVALWLAAPEIAAQASELADRAPSALKELQRQLVQYEWVNRLLEHQERLRKALPGGSEAASVATAPGQCRSATDLR